MKGEGIVVEIQVDHCVGAAESWCGSLGRGVGLIDEIFTLGLRRATSTERGKHCKERLDR